MNISYNNGSTNTMGIMVIPLAVSMTFSCLQSINLPESTIGYLSPQIFDYGHEVLTNETLGKSNLSSLFGVGKGCFDSPQEVDEFIRGERNKWI